MKEIDCAYVEERDLVGQYLAGKLPEDEAEAFEAHYLGCDRCSAEMQTTAEVRVAFGRSVDVQSPLPGTSLRRSGRDYGSLLAAAAAVAMVALGLRQLAQSPDIAPLEPVYRGATQETLALEITSEASGRLHLSWENIADAEVYRVSVLASDGVPLWTRETGETKLLIDSRTLPPPRPGISFLAKVEALDTMRAVVATSAPKALPTP